MPSTASASDDSTQADSSASTGASKADLDAASVYSQAQRAKTATSSRDILVFLIAFRILNALCIRTFFQPDEYFQSLEPAWAIAFGKESGAWITWEWEHHLRSTIHPYIFAAGYWLADTLANALQLSASTRAEILLATPKIIQAHIAACGDYYTWKLSERVYGKRSLEAWACLALTVCSPWQWFCSTRTLSNCLETTLTVVALNYWPWEWSLQPPDKPEMADSVRLEQDSDDLEPEQPLRLRRCLVLAAIACILRPTNILIWAFLTYFTLFRVTKYERVVPLDWAKIPIMITVNMPELLNATRRERWILLKEASLCGSLVLLVSTFLDWTFYKQLTFPPFKFLYFNIAKSLAVFYGRNDWHYYLSQGYPLLLTTFLPFAIIGIYEALTNKDEIDENDDDTARLTPAIRYQLASISLIVPFILSFIAHKEVRFIYPILPLLHVSSSPTAAACIRPSLEPPPLTRTTTPASSRPSSPSSSTILREPQFTTRPYRPWGNLSAYRPTILPIILLLNLLIAIFTTQHHQRGVLSVMTYLRHEHEEYYLSQPPEIAHLPPADTTMTVGFLMPCHSTPWRSHLVHPGIHAWALGCEPPVHIPPGPARQAYLDEADRFYADSQQFLQSEIGPVNSAGSKAPRSRMGLAAALLGKKDAATTTGSSTTPVYPILDQAKNNLELSPWNGGPGRKEWPEYLVFFEASTEPVTAVIASLGYSPCWRGWNSWFHDDWRRKGDVIVWRRKAGVGPRKSSKARNIAQKDTGWTW